MEQDTGKRRTLILVAGIALVLVVLVAIVAISLSGSSKASTRVIIDYGDSALSEGSQVQFNSKTVSPKGGVYQVAPGDKKLTITKTGYKDFSVSFAIKAGQTIVINARLTPSPSQSAAIKNPSEIELFPGITNVELLNVQYFEDNTWAIATINSSYGPNQIVVLQYAPIVHTWTTVLGPGDAFLEGTVNKLPKSIQDALVNNTVTDGE